MEYVETMTHDGSASTSASISPSARRNAPRFRTCPICGQVKLESDFLVKAYLDDKLVRICSLCAARFGNNPYTGLFPLHG